MKLTAAFSRVLDQAKWCWDGEGAGLYVTTRLVQWVPGGEEPGQSQDSDTFRKQADPAEAQTDLALPQMEALVTSVGSSLQWAQHPCCLKAGVWARRPCVGPSDSQHLNYEFVTQSFFMAERC